jgi:dipeptidyl-peptidase-4
MCRIGDDDKYMFPNMSKSMISRTAAFRQSALLCLLIPALFLSVYGQVKKHLTFDQIFKGSEPRVMTTVPNVIGWADDEHYLVERHAPGARERSVLSIDARTGKGEPYHDLQRFSAALGEEIDPNHPVSGDDSYTKLVYLKGNDLVLLDAASGTARQLTQDGVQKFNPTVSPDGRFVAFTNGENLYTIEVANDKERQWTNDGGGAIRNGHAAWLYYEEILGRPSRYKAFWWSPDSRVLAFYRFDESRVPVFPLFDALGVHGSLENTRYPQAGDPNPTVRIGFLAVNSGQMTWAAFDDNKDQYFGTPYWMPDGSSLWVQWMNRAQDTLVIYAVDPHSGQGQIVYKEHQSSWVEWIKHLNFLNGGKRYLLQSDKDGWMHLYLYRSDGHLCRKLTDGAWAVDSVAAIDERGGWVYFPAKKEASTRTDLYRVRLDGTGLARLTFGEYTHQVRVSPTGKFFVTTYSNVQTPPRSAVYEGNGTRVRVIGDSKSDSFDQYQLGRTELFRIMTADSVPLPAIWTLPPDFDSRKKYPVLISVYGGPGSPTVSDGWKEIANQWLAEEGLIQMSVDHRGSGHFGKTGVALMHWTLGKWEMNDYIEAAKWLRTRPFVDSTRICITGGSYGGYVTCLALTEGADYFTHGLALFSVTDWHLYDTHYVERYMGLPTQNPEGYTSGSVLSYVGKYKGLLCIVHGTMDDNVHMQNSIQLIDTLETLGKHFEMMFYPGERHGWRGPKAIELRNETYRFYYRYLIRKEYPESLFANVGLSPWRRR